MISGQMVLLAHKATLRVKHFIEALWNCTKSFTIKNPQILKYVRRNPRIKLLLILRFVILVMVKYDLNPFLCKAKPV